MEREGREIEKPLAGLSLQDKDFLEFGMRKETEFGFPAIGMRGEKRTNGKKRNIRFLRACLINYDSFWFHEIKGLICFSVTF